ncbi:hypothetical protein AAFN85_13535 [Mucilaginibacter sp. CAU 1740]|uniref:cation diffusion facilitator family transporter n=1 Tax=Mucilaginibacter sp. CAU 1740 TaxID=3140365 RepID=UPI00325BB8D7
MNRLKPGRCLRRMRCRWPGYAWRFVVLFEDLADVIGISIAFAGILLSQLLDDPLIDGIASILIGLLLTAVAVLLVRESRSLLMGETVDADELAEVKALMEKQAGVVKTGLQRSMYLGPEEVLLQADVIFENALQADEIAGIIRQLREQVQQAYPHYRHVFIEAVVS